MISKIACHWLASVNHVTSTNDVIIERPVGVTMNSGSVAVPPRMKDFVLTDKLGSGSFATVYKAFHNVSSAGLRTVTGPFQIQCLLDHVLLFLGFLLFSWLLNSE